MHKWSLLAILLRTPLKYSRFVRIRKAQSIQKHNAYYEESYDSTLYKKKAARRKIARGPFKCLANANLYHTSLIIGMCAENAWLRLPWDVWKLILSHVAHSQKQMAPVCSYFRDKIKTHGVLKCVDPKRIDYVKLRMSNFCFKKRSSSGGDDDAYRYHYYYFSDYPKRESRLVAYHNMDTHPRICSPIVNAKKFQEFEWRPNMFIPFQSAASGILPLQCSICRCSHHLEIVLLCCKPF